ncbi:MAG: EVE domain-containing protein [Planctomycetota bacterium]
MAKRAKKYWLVKSEPNAYSIDDLERDGTTPWDGVRNYQARNTMRDDMKVGDLVLFYHSNAKPPAAVGVAEVASPPYPDALQFDKRSRYHDPKSDPANPTWILVDMAFSSKFAKPVPLADLKANRSLEGMTVTQRGVRISVMPVLKKHFDAVVKMGSA